MSPNLVNATISVEDKRFYDHFGLDIKRIVAAIIADIKAMGKVQGASTITQQYARNLFLEHDKTWIRKLKEAFYAIRLEMSYSKETILEGYLNTINYGHGAYGAEAASQYYFGKSAADLTLEEATMLAGIPKGPGKYSPLVSMEKAKDRQKIILSAMRQNGYINQAEEIAAAKKPLTFIGKHKHFQLETAPYFQDTVQSVLKNELSIDERTIALGGLKVYTTLDLQDQEAAEKVIQNTMSTDSDIQVGFVSMNPKNGFITAMVGGTHYESSPFNRAVQAVRQPGSTIKPILYYAALEHGFTPSSLMRSEQTTFHFEDGKPPYTPRNFNNLYANDNMTLVQALALSDNIYAVKTHLFLGEETLVNTAKRFGITTKLAKVPSLALGSSDVRVIDMATAYSLLANGGYEIKPTLIKRIENQKGEVIYEYNKERKPVLRSDLAFVMTHMLTGIFDQKLDGYAPVTGSTIINKMTRLYAGKSGTTEADNWMIGYSPQLTAAVWTGYDKGKPIELTAEKLYAKDIWIGFMEEVHKNKPIKAFKPPKGTVGVYIDPHNGKLATKGCPVKRLTYYATGTEPTEYCTEHISEPLKERENKIEKPKMEKKTPWYKRIFQWN
ncbi:transglycosylase domain-containing protein [Bacillus aquiflavi]|uniref:transglycosylase domain-containing protein n=1 Tax=Bacillus aquiflavi TaxID=2672567 RepID=UPI00223B0569|nr:PBP1A family penicillin-binding protein [Bacillus aquiflavi]